MTGGKTKERNFTMKKKTEKTYTESDMIAKADELTEDAKFKAECYRAAELDELVEKVWDKGQTVTLLERARIFFNQAAENIAEYNSVLSRRSPILDAIVPVLAFNFHYDYATYEWDGFTLDGYDSAFNIDMDQGELDRAAQASWVVGSLEEYLLAGATKAKEIGSDTYAAWRKAFIDLNFRFDHFDEGAKEADVKAFMGGIRETARLLWADICVHKRLKTSGGARKLAKSGRSAR